MSLGEVGAQTSHICCIRHSSIKVFIFMINFLTEISLYNRNRLERGVVWAVPQLRPHLSVVLGAGW